MSNGAPKVNFPRPNQKSVSWRAHKWGVCGPTRHHWSVLCPPKHQIDFFALSHLKMAENHVRIAAHSDLHWPRTTPPQAPPDCSACSRRVGDEPRATWEQQVFSDGTRHCCSVPACMSGSSSCGADGQWLLRRALTAPCGLPAAAQRMPGGHPTMPGV